jgi:hypothetical protein
MVEINHPLVKSQLNMHPSKNYQGGLIGASFNHITTRHLYKKETVGET